MTDMQQYNSYLAPPLVPHMVADLEEPDVWETHHGFVLRFRLQQTAW